MRKSTQLTVRSTVVACLMTLTLSACAADSTKGTDGGQMRDKYLPFSIMFDQRGNPVIVDRDGNELVFEEAQFPIKSTAIEKIESITYVQYRGSHVGLVIRGGKMVAIPLPH